MSIQLYKIVNLLTSYHLFLIPPIRIEKNVWKPPSCLLTAAGVRRQADWAEADIWIFSEQTLIIINTDASHFPSHLLLNVQANPNVTVHKQNECFEAIFN